MGHIHEAYDFTTSAFILHPNDPRILLFHHKTLGKWLQPGGHIELDEDPLQALQRELQEEVGLEPSDYSIVQTAESPQLKNTNNTILPLPFYLNVHPYGAKPEHRHIDICYIVQSHTNTVRVQEAEGHGVDWLSIEEIRTKAAAGEVFDSTVQLCEWIAERYFKK